MRQIPIVRAASGRRSKPRDTHLWSALLPRNTALAVAIVIEIAIHSDGRPLNAKVLSKRYRLPPRHFEPLLQVLAHNGILHSARGVHGGYELARKPARITLEQIFIAAAADKSKAQPRLILHPGSANMKAFSKVQRSLLAALRSVSVKDLTRRARTAR